MSEHPNEEEQLTDPKPSGQASGDDNWRGDAGDQGNDIRFAEEEQLIREQGSPVKHEDEGGEYTDADMDEKGDDPAKRGKGGKPADDEGGYTDSEGTQDS